MVRPLLIALVMVSCRGTPGVARAPASSVPARPVEPAASTCSTGSAAATGSTVKIARVDVRGNARTPLAAICAGLNTQAGTAFDDRRTRHDVEWLLDSGFFDDVSVSSDASPSGRTVTFVFRERPLVRSLSSRGIVAGDAARVRELLLGGLGGLFAADALRSGLARVREDYRARGYGDVKVELRVDALPDNEVAITLDVDEGLRTVRTATSPPLADEFLLLQSAKDALRTNAREALRFADQHRDRYPQGLLAEEREVIAVEALVKLTRHAEADGRAAAFSRAYPASILRARMATLVNHPR